MDKKQRMAGFLRRRLGRLLLCGLIAALSLLLLRTLWPATFLNNDDTNIMRALSGEYSGIPSVSHPFLNIILSACVSLFYTLMPGAAWWSLFHVLALWAGITALLGGLTKAFTAKGFPLWLPLACGLFIVFSAFSYAVERMTFTLTAGILGTGALAMILSFGTEEKDLKRPLLPLFEVLFLLAACYAFRNSSGVCLLPFWLLAILYRAILLRNKPEKSRTRLLCVTMALLCILTAILMPVAHKAGILRYEGEDFYEFDEARGLYMDYPHDSYAENPGLYESIGWNETLATLAESRFFMDERINADTLRAIYEGSSYRSLSLGQKMIRGLSLGIQTARGNGQIKYLLIGMLVTLAVAVTGFVRTKKKLPLLACLCFALGGFALCFYLCCTGRFPLRTFLLIAFPTQAGMVFTAADLVNPRCALSAELTRKQRHFNLGLTAGSFLCCILALCLTFSALSADDVSGTMQASKKLNSYVRLHRTGLYLRAPLTGYDIDAYPAQNGIDLSNLIEWGGTGMGTLYMRRQLEAKNIDEFTPDILSWEGVYYVGRIGDPLTEEFEKYLIENWNMKGLEDVDTIGDLFTVYRVIR